MTVKSLTASFSSSARTSAGISDVEPGGKPSRSMIEIPRVDMKPTIPYGPAAQVKGYWFILWQLNHELFMNMAARQASRSRWKVASSQIPCRAFRCRRLQDRERTMPLTRRDVMRLAASPLRTAQTYPNFAEREYSVRLLFDHKGSQSGRQRCATAIKAWEWCDENHPAAEKIVPYAQYPCGLFLRRFLSAWGCSRSWSGIC
jgi:hypothetical protein